MTIAFQSAVFALIAISFLLVIGVPVALASPDGWSSSKNVVFSGVSLWIGSVLFVGILNSFISNIFSRCFRFTLPPPPPGGLYSFSEGPFTSGPRRRGFPYL